jgi:ABC-type lipoprotein release transport system permease subunit
MLIRIAWRNIWRNPARSLVILLSVALGLWAGIFIVSFYEGIIRQRIRSAIDNELSHIQIHHPEFRDQQDLQFDMGSGDSVVSVLKRLSAVRQSSRRVIATGMVSTSYGNSGARINGVDPDAESRMTGLSKKIRQGSWFSAHRKNEVIIGESLAKKLRLQIGRKLVITLTDRTGEIASEAFRVCGIFRTASQVFDETNLYIRLEDADRIGGMQGRVTEVSVLLQEDGQTDAVATRLRRTFPRLETKTWRELSPEMELLVVTTGQTLYIFMGIIMLALAFGIVNTMLMAILERTREIGMLIALGMGRGRIFGMILLETLLLVLAGTPAGMIPAVITVTATRKNGIDLSDFSDVLSSFGWDTVVYPVIDPAALLRVLALVVLTALLSALLPARRALRLRPANALRK